MRASTGSGERSSVDLRQQLVEIGRRWAVSQTRLVHLAVDLEKSGDWALDGSPTCAHWIAGAMDIEVCTAREWLRVGRALGRLPVITEALDEARLSFTKVRALTRLATSDNESELCAIAQATSAGRLSMELARWSARNEDPEERGRRHLRDRSLRWRTEPDGMVSVTGRMTPVQAAAFTAVVDAGVRRRDGRDRAAEPNADGEIDATRSRGSRGKRSHGPSTWLSLAQQRVDALVDVISAGGASVQTEVILHVRGDGCTLDDGTPIDGSIVERIAGEGFLRVMIHDAERRPINASGRHRLPYDRQKRVVKERDRVCVICGGTDFAEYDHVPEFARSRRTVVDELRYTCGRCHRLRHDRAQS